MLFRSLSDLSASFYEKYKEPNYLIEFQKIFESTGKKVEGIIEPIHNAIHEIMTEMGKIDFEKNYQTKYVAELTNKCHRCKSDVLAGEKFYHCIDDSKLCKKCYDSVGKDWNEKIFQHETIFGSSKPYRSIQICKEKFEIELAKLRELGLYDEHRSVVLRDKVANLFKIGRAHV